MLVDRWKVRATRRAERSAQDAARTRLAGTGDAPDSGLGSAWTPWPGMLFLADQVLHLTIAIVGWLVILEGVPLQQGFVDVVNAILRDWDRATVNAVVLTTVVLVSLFLVNTRAAYYFVLALVSPRGAPPTPPCVRRSRRRTVRDAAAAPPATRCASGRWSPRWSRGRGRHPRTSAEPVETAPSTDRRSTAPTATSAGRVRPQARRWPSAEPSARPGPPCPPGPGPHRGDHRRPGAAPDRRVRPGRGGGGRGLRHRGQDHRPVQAARRPGLRRVLPAGHAGQRVRRPGQRHHRQGRAGDPAIGLRPGCAGSARATRG